jgi:hypothetical protein
VAQQHQKHGSRPHTGRSTPVENDEQGGVKQPAQPSTNEQSGSTGRRVADGNPPPGKDTGQDHYGQSGFAGTPHETMGQASYRRSAGAGDPRSKRKSNRGSGRRDPDLKTEPSHSDQETVQHGRDESGPKTG